MSWNKFVLENQGSFLQSEEWLNFQEALGKAVVRYQNDNFCWGGIVESMPWGFRYLYIPHGPVIKNLNKFKVQEFKESLSKAINQKVIFIRTELPFLGAANNLGQQLVSAGFLSGKNIQPQATTQVELLSDAEILAKMHPKTRYNIKVADRHGIKVRMVEIAVGSHRLEKLLASSRIENDEVGLFITLLQATARRDKFYPHSENYYRQMLTSTLKTFLFFAEREGQLLAGGVVVRFGDTATYLHGASNHEQRKFMAPYLLHFEIMRTMRGLGCNFYDLWGIAPNDSLRHKLAGVTRFKLGFGGAQLESGGSYELPIHQFWYKVYRLLKE